MWPTLKRWHPRLPRSSREGVRQVWSASFMKGREDCFSTLRGARCVVAVDLRGITHSAPFSPRRQGSAEGQTGHGQAGPVAGGGSGCDRDWYGTAGDLHSLPGDSGGSRPRPPKGRRDRRQRDPRQVGSLGRARIGLLRPRHLLVGRVLGSRRPAPAREMPLHVSSMHVHRRRSGRGNIIKG